MSKGKVLIGVLAGVAAGAALGILFAPEKGAKTRKQISNKGHDYTDEIKVKFNDLLNTIKEKLSAAKEDGNDLIAEGKSKMKQAERELKDEMEQKFS